MLPECESDDMILREKSERILREKSKKSNPIVQRDMADGLLRAGRFLLRYMRRKQSSADGAHAREREISHTVVEVGSCAG